MLFSFILQLNLFESWSSCNFNTTNKRNQINAIFWCCLFFICTFHIFNKLIQPHLKAAKLPHHKWKLTVRCTWSVCFYAVAIVFLFLYQKYYLADNLYFKQNGQNYYRSYENLLFYTTNNRCSLFNSINLILFSFYLVDVLYDLNERIIPEALNKFLVCAIVVCFDVYRLEYFSVAFNILICLINLFADVLRFVCWHASERNVFIFRICASLKLLLWSYVFLNLIPFRYLIPTLYGRKFHLWLNVFLWLWYGTSVWNSPILQYIYHRIYHVNSLSSECLGGRSISRCILIKESNEYRHFRNLQQALTEIQLIEKQKTKTENSSAKTYQTIKCMIALKRKLKRIRENKEHVA